MPSGFENGNGHQNGEVSTSDLVHVNPNGGEIVVGGQEEAAQAGESWQDTLHAALFGKQKQAISVPGDTAWRGAQGAPVDVGKPPPDIVLHCQDEDWYEDIGTVKLTGNDRDENENPRVRISWDMSWSDVLDELKATFGRAVLFKYRPTDYIPTLRLVASEKEFDKFCGIAETRGNHMTVLIVNAVVEPSDWIREVPEAKEDDDDGVNGAGNGAMVAMQEGGVMPGEQVAIGMEGFDDLMIEEEESKSAWERIKDTLADTPASAEYMFIFGIGGFIVSCAVAIYCYWIGINSVAAVTLALPCNLFFISLLVSEVEDGTGPLFKMGVPFLGFWCAFIVIVCQALGDNVTILIGVSLWVLSCFWYMEIVVRALGWSSWLQGLYNLFAWAQDGCAIPGVRQKEPMEHIYIISAADKHDKLGRPVFLEPVPEGATWVEPSTGMKVKHVSQCLETLSERDRVPMGPLEKGVMVKKTARQLRKWLVRRGPKCIPPVDERRLKGHVDRGVGSVKQVSQKLGVNVVWEEDNSESWYKMGENGVYELLKIEEEQTGPEENFYDDGEKIHRGGDLMTNCKTFLSLFLPQVCKWLWVWIAFLAYFGMLYIFEISLTSYSVSQAIGGTTFEAAGRLYTAQPGSQLHLHISCKGYTLRNPGDPVDEDGRPAVILIGSEAIGFASAYARLQDLIAEDGVACAYDRVGFGFSTDREVSDVLDDRTPERIARELHFALTEGRDRKFKRPVFRARDVVGAGGEVEMVEIEVKPPFVLVGHSAGGLYARQFATDYPEDTAGLVLVDALPAHPDVRSTIQELLSGFKMTLCTRFLQPLGLVHTFLPTWVTGLFREKTTFALNGGDGEPFNDYNAIEFFMFSRQWCPVVQAEYDGIYSGGGLEAIAAADAARYDVPVVVWAREKDRIDNSRSSEMVYNSISSTRRDTECFAEEEGAEDEVSCVEVEAGKTSWFDIQRDLLTVFQNPWRNPFANKTEIMRGDKSGCATLECSELTPLENPKEIADAVLDLWRLLGYTRPKGTNNWLLEIGGTASAFDEAQFKLDLAELLSHVNEKEIFVDNIGPALPSTFDPNQEFHVDNSTSWWSRRAGVIDGEQASTSLAAGGRRSINWYSGTNRTGTAYLPVKNDGSFSFEMRLSGHKERSTQWAALVLRGLEDTQLDQTGNARREKFLTRWRVLAVYLRNCAVETGICTYIPVDLFTSLYTEPIYECPQNTYRQGTRCVACNLESTSSTGSADSSSCFSCPPYQHLKCDGSGCTQCPTGKISNRGALDISDCTDLGAWSADIKGPIGAGYTADPVTAHRAGLPLHRPFDVVAFRAAIALVADVPEDKIDMSTPPRDVMPYPESRSAHRRGESVFRVSFLFMADGASESARIISYMLGQECTEFDPVTCPLPDSNFTRRDARTALLSQFEVLSIFTENEKIVVTPDTCPRQFRIESVSRTEAPVLDETYSGNGRPHRCPSGFYQDGLGCEACPDMTASDPGAVSVSDCEHFPTVVLTIKDPSVTFDARTRGDIFGGAVDAQPNGFDIMNYTGLRAGAPLYTKARGYALQPTQLNDPANPDFGFEGTRCLEGSNCFNSSRFRLDLASALGQTTTANSVRIVNARNCLGDGLDGAVSTFCGPFPGLPLNAASLSCIAGTGGALFWTLTAPYIGTSIGVAIEDSERLRAATAADCAELCARIATCTAFLYSRSSYNCYPREIPPGSVEAPWESVCPSTSDVCRQLAQPPLEDEVESGVQMFWRVSDSDPAPAGQCPIVLEAADSCKGEDSYPNRVFDVTVDETVGGRGGTGLRSPGDVFHVVFRLHAETKTDLLVSKDIVLDAGDGADVQGATSLGAFLSHYTVIQAFATDDKQLRGGQSPEGDLLEQGHILCGIDERREVWECEPSTVLSSAWCLDPTGATAGEIAVCDGGAEGDVPRCERQYDSRDTARVGAKDWVLSCPGGGEPSCASGEEPVCLAENAINDSGGVEGSFWPLGRDGADWMTVTFSVGDTPAYMEVTRLDIREHFPFDGAPTTVGMQMIRAEFSDGSHQDLELVAGQWDNTYKHVLYIKPVITLSITLRVLVPGQDETRQLGIEDLQIFGQPVQDMQHGRAINLFQESYADGFQCPATTYRVATTTTITDPFDNLAEFQFGGLCMPCPYPKVSPQGSTTIANCTCPRCGDGRVHWQGEERCDDGNTVSGDGCSEQCEVETLHLCRGALTDLFVGQPLLSYRTPDTCIRVGSVWIDYGVAQWSPRFGAELVYHRDALWLIGGASSGFAQLHNDVWYEATNGVACPVREPSDSCANLPSGQPAMSWGVATPAADSPFQARAFHASVSFNGFLWIVGGGTHACNASLQTSCQLEESLNDVWRSPGVPAQEDGGEAQAEVQWSEVTAEAPWLRRARHGLTVLDGKLWVIGGQNIEKGLGASTSINMLFLNDVWSSTDGVEWSVATANAPWSPRAGLSVVVHEGSGRLFAMGGSGLDGNSDVYINDVWYTENGVDWSEATTHAQWEGRWMHRSVFYRDNIWVVAGQNCGEPDVWGQYRAVEACVKANGKSGSFLRDVWASPDGVSWKDATATANWPARAGHASAVFNGPDVQTFWVLGGYSGYEDATQDLWSSYIL